MWTKRVQLWRFMLCAAFAAALVAAARDSSEKHDSSEVSIDIDTKEADSAEDTGNTEDADSKENAPSVEVADEPYVAHASIEVERSNAENEQSEEAQADEPQDSKEEDKQDSNADSKETDDFEGDAATEEASTEQEAGEDADESDDKSEEAASSSEEQVKDDGGDDSHAQEDDEGSQEKAESEEKEESDDDKEQSKEDTTTEDKDESGNEEQSEEEPTAQDNETSEDSKEESDEEQAVEDTKEDDSDKSGEETNEVDKSGEEDTTEEEAVAEPVEKETAVESAADEDTQASVEGEQTSEEGEEASEDGEQASDNEKDDEETSETSEQTSQDEEGSPEAETVEKEEAAEEELLNVPEIPENLRSRDHISQILRLDEETSAEPSPAYFNILMHGKDPEVLDGTQLAADWTFSGLQKFGQGLEERLRGLRHPSKILEKVNIVEIPGILEVRKQVSRVFPFNDACQWFIDRADIIFLVYDPSKLDVGPETEAILDQLKGRESQTRIVLNKADSVKPEELMRVQSALIWNISPLMSSAQPPVMYTVSLWSMPFEAGAPVRLLQAQERELLRDLRQAIDKRIENKISSARRFAVRVRNHAKMVDCYLTTYYNHKTIFGNKKLIADAIIENPQNYHIYEGLSTLTNISRYDLPDPETYRDFFRLNPLYEFQQLAATCTYFRGCPINRLDVAIAYDLPEIVGKYKKMVETSTPQGMPKRNINRLSNTVKGKGKKGGQALHPKSIVCNVEFNNGTKFDVLSCMKGTLIEINEEKSASIFDVSHMLQTNVRGKDCVTWFESLCPVDLRGMANGSSSLTVFLTDQGGIIDDLIVTKVNDETLYIVSNAGRLDVDKAHMIDTSDKLRQQGKDVTVEFWDVSERALIAIQGPKAASLFQSLTDFPLTDLTFMSSRVCAVAGVEGCRVTRCGYTGEDGVEVSIPAEQANHVTEALLESTEIKLAGLAVRDSLRLEAGLCLYGNDIDETVTPVEANLTWLISKRRRGEANFPGADIILRQIKEGVGKRRVGIRMESGAPARKDAILKNANTLEVVDTSRLYTTAFQNIVSKFGKNYDWETKVKLMGLQMHEAADFMISRLDLPMSRDELIEEKGYEMKTSKNHLELFSLFPYKTFGSDPEVKKGKPAPDTFLVAATKFPDKPAPAQCLVFEDAVNGVKAAKTAGMQVVMVPDARLDRSLTKEATLVLDSLEDFKPEVFDTEELYTVAFQNIVSKFGKNYTYELKVSLMGSQAHETADRIIKALDLPLSRDEFVDISKKEFADLFPTTEVLPGARRLIEHLHKHNIPIGLATSSSVESYELKTNHHQQLFSLFPFKTFGSDSEVRQGKPSPDIFFVAAGRFPDKPDPSKCLVFEDSVNGVKAAKAAGMQVVMVPDSRLDKSYTKEATLVLNSLEDFKPEVFSLPPYDD
ncbi:hypothetical protein MSG28_011876 [Choristoneura fumiferana]|uniref:Uncharacterized protein n=1 Tax=Choristoneura fumiferana TaxID=7141 RepID=A0ACC0KN84_CHOFU|nr:hypothetical protein MSG28_011876 [Choristoneura fumiferana]